METENVSYRKLSCRHNLPLSTVYRTISKSSTNPNGITSYVLKKSDGLTMREKRLRLNFGEEFQGHDWLNTIYLDETNVELFPTPNKKNLRDRRTPYTKRQREVFVKKVGSNKFGVILGIHYKSKMGLIVFADKKRK